MYNLDALYQRSGRSRNNSLKFNAFTTGSQTLVTALDATRTIYVQQLVVVYTTDAAQSVTFQDSAGVPFQVELIPASPGVGTRWEFVFTPKGVPLTLGKNLVAVFSGAGPAGHIEWMTYQTPTDTPVRNVSNYA